MSTRRRRPAPTAASTVVIAYRRVSTEEQGVSGAGLGAQRQALETEALRRGWTEVEWIEDAGFSGKNLKRPGIQAALAQLARGEAGALVVSKLDRLSRSIVDTAGLMERARREGWALIALDVDVDTSTPSGELLTNIMASANQFERRVISQRTKDALAVKRAQGVHTGRRSTLDPAVKARIVTMYDGGAGLGLSAIARELNEEGAPTGQGGARWYPSSVRAVATGQR
jgi:DNA invertase Pin-like site-specific DNA recombinase